jgi:hypothetical protein
MPGRFRFFASAIAVALVVAGSAAHAANEGTPDAFAERLFAGPVKAPKVYGCFTRQYDAAHMAQHKLQKVSAMKLLVTAEKVPEDEALNYSFRVGVKFRNRSGNFDSSGDCGHPKLTESGADHARLACSVDCDGGGIEVELAPDNKSTLIRLDHIRIWRDNAPDEEASDHLVGGADDRVFKLDRTSLKDCESLVTDRKELAAMRRK